MLQSGVRAYSSFYHSPQEIMRQSHFPYRRVGCCNDHSSAVQHVDFDRSSRYIQSVSASNEILYAYVSSTH
jgi:hypothetical protein